MLTVKWINGPKQQLQPTVATSRPGSGEGASPREYTYIHGAHNGYDLSR